MKDVGICTNVVISLSTLKLDTHREVIKQFFWGKKLLLATRPSICILNGVK